jgi:hypothetical protein
LAFQGARHEEIISEPQNDHEAKLAINDFMEYAKTGI